jgi:hypothetical protein
MPLSNKRPLILGEKEDKNNHFTLVYDKKMNFN